MRKQQMEELILFKVLDDLGQPLVDQVGMISNLVTMKQQHTVMVIV